VLGFKTCFGQVPRVPEHSKAEPNNKPTQQKITKKMPTKINGKEKKRWRE
jgi:hypothetical protein